MLSEPDLVSGLRDLLADPDPAVVKRTIRVFANVYRHALHLLATGDLDQGTFGNAWPAVKGVAEQLMGMLVEAENEGVIIHIVRFLEAALVAHLITDVSNYPEIASEAVTVVCKGVDALKNLLTTPYVGGSSFIVAMRAIITVACYKPEIREDVIELIEKQISSPPPTLFDHNVRSSNKILQRNLFRLLRRATSVPLRSRLIEMMVTVGVPRRLLSQWAPPQEARKRPVQLSNSDDIITGRSTPPNKRAKHEASTGSEGRTTPPSDPRDSKTSKDIRELKDPRLTRESHEVEDSRMQKDPRTSRQSEESGESRISTTRKSPTPPRSPTNDFQQSVNDRPVKEKLSVSEKSSSKPNSPCPSGRSTPEGTKENRKSVKTGSKANFEFLKNLITSTKETEAAKPFLQQCTEKERSLYERLDHPSVVELVLSCLECVPDSPPDNLLTQLGYSGGDVNGIREHLTTILAPHIPADFINSLTPPHESSSVPVPAAISRPSSTSSASTAFSSRSSPPLSNHRESSPPSPPSSNRSTPTDPNQVCVSDVDLRQLLDRGFRATGDVDMRTSDPRRDLRDQSSKMNSSNSRNDPRVNSRNSPIDPRLSTAPPKTTADPRASTVYPRTSEAEQRTTIATSSIIDPRITANDPRRGLPDGGNGPRCVTENMNPSLPKPFPDIRDPRMSVPPPDPMMNNDRNFPGMGIDPRMNMPNGGAFDQSFGNKFGMHCGMNHPDPRMMNGMPGMNFGKGPMGNIPVGLNNRLGPMNVSDPGFMGGPGMFGSRPGPNLPPMGNGPWQNMMPMHNNGQGMFSQAPPMHL